MPVKTKNEIMDEIKAHLAALKIAKAIKSLIRVKRAMKERVKQEAIKAQLRISRMLIGKLYRRLFRKKILISTLYLESSELIVLSNAKVQVFGNFTRNQWGEKLTCIYDERFGCFKCDKVRIMIGHVFKFIVNDHHYIVSNRYPVLKDSSGNFNNYYDPKRIKRGLPRIQSQIPHL